MFGKIQEFVSQSQAGFPSHCLPSSLRTQEGGFPFISKTRVYFCRVLASLTPLTLGQGGVLVAATGICWHFARASKAVPGTG